MLYVKEFITFITFFFYTSFELSQEEISSKLSTVRIVTAFLLENVFS